MLQALFRKPGIHKCTKETVPSLPEICSLSSSISMATSLAQATTIAHQDKHRNPLFLCVLPFWPSIQLSHSSLSDVLKMLVKSCIPLPCFSLSRTFQSYLEFQTPWSSSLYSIWPFTFNFLILLSSPLRTWPSFCSSSKPLAISSTWYTLPYFVSWWFLCVV